MQIEAQNKTIVEKFDDSVVSIEYDAKAKISPEDLQNVEETVNQLIGNQSYYAISMLTDTFKNFSDEAKDFITGKNNKLDNRVLDCYIVNSLSKRLELEVFFQLHKPARKIKIFNSLNKALTFIASQKGLEDNEKGMLV